MARTGMRSGGQREAADETMGGGDGGRGGRARGTAARTGARTTSQSTREVARRARRPSGSRLWPRKGIQAGRAWRP
jgi:hypothetical protein